MRVNWLAVLISAVVIVLLRYLWFAHFGGADWAATPAKALADVQGNLKAAGFELVRALIVAGVLGWVIGRLRDRSLPSGLIVGIAMAIGFAVTTAADGVIQGAPYTTLLVGGGYLVVAYAIAGAILGAMAPKRSSSRPSYTLGIDPAPAPEAQ